MSAKTDPLPPVVVTRMEVRMQDPNVSIQQITVAQITLEGGQWVLELLPGQTYKPEAMAKMDGRWATKATTVDEARETLAEAAHALVALLDAQAAERQAFVRRIDKATSTRQATLPLGEHDPLDDREDGHLLISAYESLGSWAWSCACRATAGAFSSERAAKHGHLLHRRQVGADRAVSILGDGQ